MKQVAMLIGLTIITFTGYCQSAPGKPADSPGFTTQKAVALGPEYNTIRPMVGNWRVQQRSWAKAGAPASTAPTFAVRRQLIGHFLQEVIEPVAGTQVDPFTRITYLNFNNANRRWEYIVLDTRYPVMMFETSVNETIQQGNQLTLYLDAFVMPDLGDKGMAGQLAKQRRTITFDGPNRQVVRQFWTLPAGKEYLAIEYVYTKAQANKPASK